MKKLLSFIGALAALLILALPVSAESGNTLAATGASMRIAMIVLLSILVALILMCILLAVLDFKKAAAAGRKPRLRIITVLTLIATAIVLACCVLCMMRYVQVGQELAHLATAPETTEAPTEQTTEETTEATTEATTVPTEPPEPTLSPAYTDSSNPANWDIKWELIANDAIIDSFQREETIDFDAPETYYPLPAIPTFRGDNYRTGSTYGTVNVTEKTLTTKWTNSVGSLDGWPGVGWTGQPLVVQWDGETRAVMGLYDSKKEKEDLVEVICTTLDGYIYFYDLEDGSATRDPIWIGMSFKGTASLDPRGYPILYAGSGLVYGKSPRMYAISLVDNSIIWEQNGSDSFAYRGWYAFDSSPMISAETDTLIWGCESGIIYTIKLNTAFDKATGTLTQAPENVVKVRYSTNTGHTIGFESSCIMVDNYLFIGDNGGMLFCIDINTMALLWAQNTGDDINATPVFQWEEDGNGYLYTATSMEYGGGTSYVYKINANNGEIVWQKSYSGIIYDKDVSGGILASPVLGKEGTDLEGTIIYAVAKTPASYSGILFALDTETGEVVWEQTMGSYTWSSPVAVYTPEGKGYICIGDASGNMHLVDGATGETLTSIGLGSNMEASPIVFNNTLVIGTRGQRIAGITIE